MLRFAAFTLNQNKNVYVQSCNRYLKPEITFKAQVPATAEVCKIWNPRIVKAQTQCVLRSLPIQKRSPRDILLILDKVTGKHCDLKTWRRARFVSLSPNEGKIFGHGPVDTVTYMVPKYLPNLESAVFETLASAVATCRHVDLQEDDHLLILGGGPIGLSVLLVARAMGVKRIIISDMNLERLKTALEMGATQVVLADDSMTPGTLAKRIITEIGGMPNRTIDCCGRTETSRLTAGLTMPGGICLIVSSSYINIELPVLEALSQEVRIKAFFRSYNTCAHTWSLPLFGNLFPIQLLVQTFFKQNSQKFLKQSQMPTREKKQVGIFVKQLKLLWQQKQEGKRELEFNSPSRMHKIDYISNGYNKTKPLKKLQKLAYQKLNKITRKHSKKERECPERKYKNWTERTYKRNVQERTKKYKKLKKFKTTISCDKGKNCDALKKSLQKIRNKKNDKCKNNDRSPKNKEDDEQIQLTLRKDSQSKKDKSKGKTKCLKLLNENKYKKKGNEEKQSKSASETRKSGGQRLLDQIKDKCRKLAELKKFEEECAELAMKQPKSGCNKNMCKPRDKCKFPENQCKAKPKKCANSKKCLAKKCKGKPKKCQRNSKCKCKPKCKCGPNCKCRSKNKCKSRKNDCDNKCS